MEIFVIRVIVELHGENPLSHLLESPRVGDEIGPNATEA